MTQGDGLRDAYSATLARIKAQGESKSRLGMDMLMWLSHSERALKTRELCDALGVEIGSADLNSQNIPAMETLVGCSLGLVVVEASKYTVRLVHHTLQEHLLNDTNLFHSPHETIAQVCLTYLNFQCVRDLSNIPYRPLPLTPLLEYASCYWGIHARRGITKSVNTLVLRLLNGFDNHVSSGILLSHSRDNWDRSLSWSNSAGFTGLHGAAYLGMVETIALLEMKKWDLGATDVTGNTAISWAARRGHEAIVGILLEREDVTPDTTDKNGRTPLSWAAGNGHGGIVKMLLEREDVTPNATDKNGRTPLSWAAGNGHGGVVKMLLGREDVTLNSADKNGRTPLIWAAGNGNDDVVKMLLEWEGVTPDTTDKGGRSALLWAARFRRDRIVKMLLGRKDIIPDPVDEDGRTPLSWAAANGGDAIVKRLLEREDVAPGRANKNGRTPLTWAVVYGHGSIVKMLLEREDLASDTADKDGTTPLSWAAKLGNEDIVKMLLEQGGAAPDARHKNGQTPLSWAVEHGHIRVVEMLLERCSFSQDMLTTDPARQTALTQAPGKKPRGVIKRRFEDQGSVPQLVDRSSSMNLVPAEPSEPSLRPSKRIRRS